MFDSMIDEALCIDIDAEFALADAPLHTLDPSYGTGATLHEPTLDSAKGEALYLGVTQYS